MKAPHIILALLGLLLLPASAFPVAASGPEKGEKPLPFTSNFVTGPQRGKQYCYVCELKEEPALMVFIRRLDEPTTALLKGMLDAVREHRKSRLFAWAVVLGPDRASEAELEKQVYAFARARGVSPLPISVLGDPLGPPGYRIAPEAVVTLVAFRHQSVTHNRSYTASDWTPAAAARALDNLSEWLGLAR